MIDRVLVALDGSPLAEQTLPFASAVARAFGAEVILLRVVERPAGPPRGALDSFDWRMERTAAFRYLRSVSQSLRDEGVQVDVDVTDGRASEQILEMARVREVDLIVVGSHGTGGLSSFRMASTAHEVAFFSEISTLVVRVREGLAQGPPFQTVLAPVDCTSRSDWSVNLAARLAKSQGASLVILHVVRQPTLLDPQGSAREREIGEELVTLHRRAATRYAQRLKQRLQSPELTVEAQVEVAADLAEALERCADAASRPLMVLSSRGHEKREGGPHGDLVAVMLAHSAHPLLVLREPGRRTRVGTHWSRRRRSVGRSRSEFLTE